MLTRVEIFTLGHSTHSLDYFAGLLRDWSVTAVADVRSSPYSRLNPQFSRENFAAGLRRKGVAYSFLGKELGARPTDRSCYVNGRARYDLIARTALFASGLDRLAVGSESYRLALVCAEKDPMTCHRAILVGRHLAQRGFSVRHILASGDIEDHDAGIRRVSSQLKLPLRDLFRSQEELLADVYARRAHEIEYVEAAGTEEHP